MPVEEDIANAYKRYYTHERHEEGGATLRSLSILTIRKLIYRLIGVGRLTQEHKKLWAMYVDDMAPGRLLDVGCGSGARLLHFQKAGWEVEGQEIDPEAAESARKTAKARVFCVPLESARLAAHSYDVIIMNHVIEHVHRPIDLLRECGRIVKPGGLIVAVTPNSESCGHNHFGKFWRGLEPPRHVFIYCPASIAHLADQSGFSHFDIWTSAANAEDVFLRSASLESQEAGGSGSIVRTRTRAFRFLRREYVETRTNGVGGEDLVLRIHPSV